MVHLFFLWECIYDKINHEKISEKFPWRKEGFFYEDKEKMCLCIVGSPCSMLPFGDVAVFM